MGSLTYPQIPGTSPAKLSKKCLTLSIILLFRLSGSGACSMTAKLTPTKAIRAECRFCMNSTIFKGCNSKVCKLNDLSLSPLKRIKAHCVSCVPEQNLKAVRACTGELTNNKACPLHPYRAGSNPKRKGIGNRNATFKTRTHDTLSGSNFNQNNEGHIRGNRA